MATEKLILQIEDELAYHKECAFHLETYLKVIRGDKKARIAKKPGTVQAGSKIAEVYDYLVSLNKSFTAQDVVAFTKKKKWSTSDSANMNFITRLLNKGMIYRIEKGVYDIPKYTEETEEEAA